MLPTIWGLFSKKIGLKAVWATTLVGFVSAAVVKFGLNNDGFLTGVGFLQPSAEWVGSHSRIADLTTGILVPLILLVILEVVEKHEHPGWQRVMESQQAFHESAALQSSHLPARMVAITLGVIAVMMTILSMINRAEGKILITFAVVLYAIGGTVFLLIRRADAQPEKA